MDINPKTVTNIDSNLFNTLIDNCCMAMHLFVGNNTLLVLDNGIETNNDEKLDQF